MSWQGAPPANRILTATGPSEVDPDQLDHVRLQQVDVPPGGAFDLRLRAGGLREEGTGAAVDGLLGETTLQDRGLHGRFAGRDV